MNETQNCIKYFILTLVLYSPLFLLTKEESYSRDLRVMYTTTVTDGIETTDTATTMATTVIPFTSLTTGEITENMQATTPTTTTTTLIDTTPLIVSTETVTSSISPSLATISTTPFVDTTYNCPQSESYVSTTESNGYYNLSVFEISILEKLVSCEYGADWVSVEEKSKIVAGVMNRVKDERFPNTIYEVIVQPGQFTGFDPYGEYYMSDSIRESVKYYFEHENEYGIFNSWWGDGYTNYFYYQ